MRNAACESTSPTSGIQKVTTGIVYAEKENVNMFDFKSPPRVTLAAR